MPDEGNQSQPNQDTFGVPLAEPQPMPEPQQPPQEPPVNYSEPQYPIQDEETGSSGIFRKILSFVVIVAVLGGIGAGGYYLWRRYGRNIVIGRNQEAQNNQNTEPKQAGSSNMETYTNSSYSFKFNYPKDMTFREEPSGEIYLAKLGSTQKEGTELYDGVWLSMTPGSLNEKSVKDIVDARISELTSQGNTTISKQPELVTVAEKTAYKFEADVEGPYIYYYLALGPENYIVVVDGTRDPEGKGYSKEVEEVIKSIEFSRPISSN